MWEQYGIGFCSVLAVGACVLFGVAAKLAARDAVRWLQRKGTWVQRTQTAAYVPNAPLQQHNAR